MDIDTIRCRNEAIERDSILVSLEPVGVEIKQLSTKVSSLSAYI